MHSQPSFFFFFKPQVSTAKSKFDKNLLEVCGVGGGEIEVKALKIWKHCLKNLSENEMLV